MSTSKLCTCTAVLLGRRFTVLELLVVVAIITILAAILLPAMGTARGMAKHSRWLGFKNQMSADGSLVLHHTFEDEGENELPNQAIGDPLSNEDKHDTHTSTVSGATWISNGGRWRSKPSLYFDGNNDQVVSTYRGVGGSNDRSMSAWIQTEENNRAICSWGDNTNSEKWTFRVNNTGTLRIEVSGGHHKGNAVRLDDGKWHHVVGVFENDGSPDVLDARLYVDGVLLSSTSGSSETVDTDTDDGIAVRIGNDHLSRNFSGMIDEFAIFDKALSATEVLDMYKMGQP